MRVYEATTLLAIDEPFVVVRVPDDVLQDMLLLALIMDRAELEWPDRSPVILAAGTGQMFGHPHHRRLLRAFDPAKATWAQWNMAD